MIGGFIKSNRIAALAGAGVIASTLAVSPAMAADLGGDCCADLEERVATLEATTARKGNRKVSLTISGWVNSGVMIWDDGVDSDAYVVSDNDTTLSSRITFAGDAKINSDWSAGYNITIETQSSTTLLGVSQANDDSTNLGILYSYMYLKSEQLGTLSWGQQSQATDNVSIVDHSGTLFSGNNVVFRGNSFAVRGTANTWQTYLACSGLNGVGIGTDCTGVPTNSIKYETPTISGFTLSASWGEDDFYDVALRYAGEFNGFKVGAAIGYSETNENPVNGLPAAAGNVEAEILSMGASIMHVATGIFVSGSYEHQESDALVAGDSDSWYIKAGIKQRWNSLGATAIYGEYANYENTALTASAVGTGEVERFGVGLHQWVDAAALQLYAKWDHLELDYNSAPNAEDLDMFTFGGVIFF